MEPVPRVRHRRHTPSFPARRTSVVYDRTQPGNTPPRVRAGIVWNLDSLKVIRDAEQRAEASFERWNDQIAASEEGLKTQKQQQLVSLREEHERRENVQQAVEAERMLRQQNEQNQRAELQRAAVEAALAIEAERLIQEAARARRDAELQQQFAEQQEQARAIEASRQARRREEERRRLAAEHAAREAALAEEIERFAEEAEREAREVEVQRLVAQQEEQRARVNAERERVRIEEEERRRLAAEFAAREAAVAQETARRAQELERERFEVSFRRLVAEQEAVQARIDGELRRTRAVEEERRRVAAEHAAQEAAAAAEEERILQEATREQMEVEFQRLLLEEMEAQARADEERQRARLREQEAEARAEEERRRARLRDCAACMEQHDMSEVVQLACAHWYCRDALQGAISTASVARRPFQCCRQTVQADTIQGTIAVAVWTQYQALLEETQEVNPVYCSRRTCATFLPSRLATNPDEIQCPRCATRTCRHCKGPSHPQSECVHDVATQQARDLARARGWKSCPRCQSLVEKSSGCMHMSCRCGAQFCYRCGRPLSECNDRCA